MPAGLDAALDGAVGAHHVLIADDLRAACEIDWTRRFTGRTRAVVRPGSTKEVAAVLRACQENGAKLLKTALDPGGLLGPGVMFP